MVGIYKITSPSGKIYIGQSISIEARLSKYRTAKCKSQAKLYYSINKYGWDAHRFEIVHELPTDTSRDVLDIYEQLYIQAYRDCGALFLNIREGGYTGRLSDESKIKMSKARSGERNGMFGKRHSIESRKKISTNTIGKQAGKNNPMFGKKGEMWPSFGKPVKLGKDNPNYGRKHTPEAIDNMKAAQLKIKRIGPDNPRFGVKFSYEHKTKISSALKGHPGFNNKEIGQFNKSGDLIKYFSSIKNASRDLGIQASDINKCCKNVIKSAGGFIWKYKNEHQ